MKNPARFAAAALVALAAGCGGGDDPIVLALLNTTSNSVTIEWHESFAMSSDGTMIPRSHYDVRYSSTLDQPFDEMTSASAVPAPTGTQGATAQMEVIGLSPATTYQIVMRGFATDPQNGNETFIDSNRIEATTEADPIPPDPVTDLDAQPVSESTIVLTWTAPGDDGGNGVGMQYEVRYSLLPITNDTEFSAAMLAFPAPDPLPAGTSQSFSVGKLADQTTYYFSMRTHDDGGNVSAISTVNPSAMTGAPAPKEKAEKRGFCGLSASAGPAWMLALLGLAVLALRR